MTHEGKPAEALQTAPVSDPSQPDSFFGFEDDKPQDECGVIGVISDSLPVATITYDGMQELQHRGQSGAGLAHNVPESGQVWIQRGNGLVDHAVPMVIPTRLDSVDSSFHPTVAIGHTRYSTANSNTASQPFKGPTLEFVLAHNGHIEDLSAPAAKYEVDPTEAASDSHLLTLIIEKAALTHGSLDEALRTVLPTVDGAYSLTIMDGDRLIGVRDPWGYHPLSIGSLPNDGGYVLASESAAFPVMGASFLRDVSPGEIVTLKTTGVESQFMERQEPMQACMFEYIYIARPDGEVNGVHVQMARQNMGQELAKVRPVAADLIVGVPDSGLDAAQGYADASGIPFAPRAIMKNQYVGRSFIEREGSREATLARKLRLSLPQIEGKSLVVVDDSMIKGKTMGVLVKMLREAGASEVHLRFASPHFRYPCYMGLDTRETWRLIARDHSDEEIAAHVDADSVAFNTVLSVEQAIHAARGLASGPMLGRLCTACATGNYAFSVPAAAHAGMNSSSRVLSLTPRS